MEGLLKRPDMAQTKEETALHRQFVLNGMRLIHGPEMRDQVIERLSQGDPTDAVAEISMLALSKLEESAEAQGRPIDDTTELMAGNELVGEVIATGEAAGAFEMDEESRALAFNKVISRVLERDIKNGKINPQELLAAGRQAQERSGVNLRDGAQKLGLKNLNLPGV